MNVTEGVDELGLLGFVICLIWLLTKLDWAALAGQKFKQVFLLGIALGLGFLWQFQAGVKPGLEVHFLGLTATTLIFGYRKALLTGTLALFLQPIIGDMPWSQIGVYGLLGVYIPVTLSYVLFAWAYHKLPRHFLVYIFFCAFFTGALCIALKMLSISLYFAVSGEFAWQVVMDNYLILTPLLLFPEAMLNGMTMTLMVVHFPQLTETFSDREYLNK